MLTDTKVISKVYQDDNGYYVVCLAQTTPKIVGQLSNWCYDNFGTGLVGTKVGARIVQTWVNDYTWRWIDNLGQGIIKFPDKADFAWFMLAWQ